MTPLKTDGVYFKNYRLHKTGLLPGRQEDYNSSIFNVSKRNFCRNVDYDVQSATFRVMNEFERSEAKFK
jgi:hypothetical protein